MAVSLWRMKPKNQLIVLLLVLSTACKKNNDIIPNVAVNEYIQLSLPAYYQLNVTGNWIYYSAGYRGLIICRNSPSTFIVMDRACTYDYSSPTAIVQGQTNAAFGTDSLCGSQFSLFDGSVYKGPATRALKQYRTNWDQNSNVLHIYN